MKFAKGDNIVCINNKSFESQLTIGKEYPCLNYINCADTVLVKNNLGKKETYGSTNFRKK